MESNVQNYFKFTHITLAIHSNFRNGISFSITDMVRTKFMLYRFLLFLFDRFRGNIDYLKNTFNQTSTFFKRWCNFHIDQMKGRLVKRQLKTLGMVQKNLYRTTLFTCITFVLLDGFSLFFIISFAAFFFL